MPESPAPAPNLPELSVSELAFSVKRTMEQAYERVRVRGELGRVTIAKSGHLYADLKDENACISVVMWKNGVSSLRFRPTEGLEVIAEGKLSTFPNKSQYQLVADRMDPSGEGALLAQLERLKAKLAGQGLFAPERKKRLPFLPDVIGVVTSPSGAVIRDILHRLQDRFPRRVLVWPVLVQGEHAAPQIVAAIKGFNALAPGGDPPRPDVLIVARGGGSIEDLWAFNEESVVLAAAQSAIPLISAVGHETDTTLIDFASDLRSPTPTAAAEAAVPVRSQLIEQTTGLGSRLVGALVRGVERLSTELRASAGRLPRPDSLLLVAQQRADRVGDRLERALTINAQAARGRFDRTATRLRPERLSQDIVRRQERLRELGQRLEAAAQRRLSDKARLLAQTTRLVDSLSHKSVLARGFALVRRGDDLVRSAEALRDGDAVSITLVDGDVAAVVGDRGASAPRKRGANGRPGEQGSLF